MDGFKNLTKSLEDITKSIKDVRTRLESLWNKSVKKEEIEGYLITTDGEKSLLLVQESSKYWKTKWFDNSLFIYKSPITPLNEIFKTK